MNISEEYIRRHGLQVPIIQYPHNLNVFIVNEEYDWQIFSGDWREETNHPGMYHFRWMRPRYNSHTSKEMFEDVRSDFCVNVHWDDYEEYIYWWLTEIRQMQKSGYRAIMDIYEAFLVMWEIFLYTHDGWIVTHVKDKKKFYDLAFQSTNKKYTLDERHDFYTKARDLIDDDYYYDLLSNYTWGYADWLVRLI